MRENILRDKDKKQKKQETGRVCPVCGKSVRPGFDTKHGRVYVCEKYPRCNYIVILGVTPFGS